MGPGLINYYSIFYLFKTSLVLYLIKPSENDFSHYLLEKDKWNNDKNGE